jgi:hypothetical protein
MSVWTKKGCVDTKDIAAKIAIVYKKGNSSVNPILVTVSGRGCYE